MNRFSLLSKNIGTIAILSGALATLIFFLYLLFIQTPIGFNLDQLLDRISFLNTSVSNEVITRLFILSATFFSGALWFFVQIKKKDAFIEGGSFYFLSYLILLFRSFVFTFDPDSFMYILLAGIQVLITLIGLLFFVLSFLNLQKYSYVLLLTFGMLLYLASVVHSVFLSEFILPNFGSLLAAGLNTITLFLYVLKEDTKVFATN